MAETIHRRKLAYFCECGRRWAFTEADDRRQKCRCGNTIVARRGIVYSQRPAPENGERDAGRRGGSN